MNKKEIEKEVKGITLVLQLPELDNEFKGKIIAGISDYKLTFNIQLSSEDQIELAKKYIKEYLSNQKLKVSIIRTEVITYK